MDIIKAEKVGMSSERLNRINELTDSYIQQGKLAGTVTMLARKGEVAHLRASGQMSTETGESMKEDSIFRIYSMTKPVTSVAIMILYERGYFQLDTPVSKFIPEFKDLQVFDGGTIDDYKTVKPQREMNMADLLKHTSGLTYSILVASVVDRLYVKNNIMPAVVPGLSLEGMVKQLSQMPLLFSPGTAWNYSVSTDVLGYIVEVISGKTLAEFFKEEIFDPLGMDDTGFQISPDKINRFTSNYIHRLAVPSLMPNADLDSLPDKAIFLMDDAQKSAYAKPPSLYSGGGGLISTAADYYKFLKMLLDQGRVGKDFILSPKTVQLMKMNHLPGDMKSFLATQHVSNNKVVGEISPEGSGFGLGFSVLIDQAKAGYTGSVGIYSWGGAASTFFFIDPKEELVAIFLTQFMPSSIYPIRNQFRTAVYQSIIESEVES